MGKHPARKVVLGSGASGLAAGIKFWVDRVGWVGLRDDVPGAMSLVEKLWPYAEPALFLAFMAVCLAGVFSGIYPSGFARARKGIAKFVQLVHDHPLVAYLLISAIVALPAILWFDTRLSKFQRSIHERVLVMERTTESLVADLDSCRLEAYAANEKVLGADACRRNLRNCNEDMGYRNAEIAGHKRRVDLYESLCKKSVVDQVNESISR